MQVLLKEWSQKQCSSSFARGSSPNTREAERATELERVEPLSGRSVHLTDMSIASIGSTEKSPTEQSANMQHL